MDDTVITIYNPQFRNPILKVITVQQVQHPLSRNESPTNSSSLQNNNNHKTSGRVEQEHQVTQGWTHGQQQYGNWEAKHRQGKQSMTQVKRMTNSESGHL